MGTLNIKILLFHNVQCYLGDVLWEIWKWGEGRKIILKAEAGGDYRNWKAVVGGSEILG